MGARVLATDRIKDEVVGEMMTVTPKLAKEWLESHVNIRPLSKTRAEAYAGEMKAGRWKANHQAIGFDEDNNLIDGQHRLYAVVLADIPVRLFVCRSRGVTIHDAIDRGTPRSLATITGRRPRELSAVGVLRYFELGQLVHRPLTLGEANELFEHHAQAFEAIKTVPSSARLVGGAVAALVWAHPCQPNAVLKFAEQLARGEMIRRGDPAYAFRAWQARPNGRRAHAESAGLAAANCLRYFINGDPLSSVFDGESGYRALTAQRRKHRVPNTPDADTLPGVAMKLAHGETSRDSKRLR